MDMTGERYIPLPQQQVWEALNDPEVLKACIPGCDSIEKLSDTEYKVAMTAAVGPVKAKFSGKLQLSDLNPPSSYSLAFEGSGGAAGFGKGGAQVSLAPEAGGTATVTYVFDRLIAVPEPGTLALLAAGLVVLPRRRKR